MLNQQVFTLTPEEGVTVTLSGVMPVKGYAEAEPAEVEDEGVLHVYDITIRYPDGSEFEPAQDAPVSVRFESAAIADAIADKSTSLAVEHITDGGETESVFLSVAEDDRAEFLATGFSVYLIKEEDGDLITPRKTFWYLDSNWTEYSDNTGNDNSAYYVSGLYKFPNTAGEMISTQIVKNGEKLHPIVLPENHDWGAFYGWYIVTLDFVKSQAATIAETGKTAEEIKGIRDLTQFVYKWVDNPTLIMAESEIEVTKDEDVFLAPHYSRYRFVNFHEHVREGEEDTSNIVARKLLVLGNNISDTIDIGDVSANSPDPEHKIFYGWQYGNRVIQTRRATGDVIPQSITVTEEDLNGGDSVDLYAVFKDARWIYFVQGERDWNARYLGAMFAYLYDETIPAEERVTISQLPTTTRTGYIFDGWYTGHLDENEHIVYEQQVSMALKDASVVGNSSIITTEGETIIIGTQGSYIHMGKLYLKEELTLYAKWRPVNTADVKVVVWKQKASDNKNAANDAKTYDYYDYKLLEDQETGSVALDNSAFIDLHFEDLADSPIEKYQKDFRGFHYDRTMVAVNNHVYDGNIPSERVNGVVAPDGTTVINIYYDRNLMAINFYYRSTDTAPSGAVSNEDYIYTEGSPTSNPLYGIVDNQYVQLNMSSTSERDYVYRYEYFPVDNDDTGSNRFGVVGNEYVPLTRNLLYNWTKTGTWYEYTTERNTSKTYTGIKNGAFVTVSYSWLRWRVSGSAYNGDFYNVYTNGAEYLYNNAVYSGTRYARTEYKKTSFTGDKRYKKTANGFVETTDETGTLYGKRGDNYEEIVKETKTVYTYTLQSDPNTVYEGPFYTRSKNSIYTTTYSKRLTWTGLYGQTFAQAGYSWSDVNSVKWKDVGGSSTQTLLDSFSQTANPYNLESNGTNGSNEIRHLKQKPDGTYENVPFVAKTDSTSANFNFENKFYGFEVVGYSTDGFHSSDTDSNVKAVTSGTGVDVSVFRFTCTTGV